MINNNDPRLVGYKRKLSESEPPSITELETKTILFSNHINFYSYVGDTRDDLPHGFGTLKFLDGRVLYADFDQGNCGHGRLNMLKNGKVIAMYIGDLSNFKPHGKGCLKSEGLTYIGPFENGLRHGFAKVTRPDGTQSNENWENDSFKSIPVQRKELVQLMEYEGFFLPDQLTGFGQSINLLTGEIFKGSFVRGLPEGSDCVYTSASTEYRGDCVEGKFHGFGQLKNSDGEYAGRFNKGLRQDRGREIYKQSNYLKAVGIDKNDHFIGRYQQDVPYTGEGFVFDRLPAYGNFVEGKLVSGVGFDLSDPKKIFIGIFKDGLPFTGEYVSRMRVVDGVEKVIFGGQDDSVKYDNLFKKYLARYLDVKAESSEKSSASSSPERQVQLTMSKMPQAPRPESGFAAWTDVTAGHSYVGQWDKGLCVSGKATYKTAQYSGDFKNMKPDGVGLYETEELKYEGFFKEGKRDGKGKIVYKLTHILRELGFAEDDTLEGNFHANNPSTVFGFYKSKSAKTMTYGMRRDAKFVSGVGYLSSEDRVFAGRVKESKPYSGTFVYQKLVEGKLQKLSIDQMDVPTSTELFNKYLADYRKTLM